MKINRNGMFYRSYMFHTKFISDSVYAYRDMSNDLCTIVRVYAYLVLRNSLICSAFIVFLSAVVYLFAVAAYFSVIAALISVGIMDAPPDQVLHVVAIVVTLFETVVPLSFLLYHRITQRTHFCYRYDIANYYDNSIVVQYIQGKLKGYCPTVEIVE